LPENEERVGSFDVIDIGLLFPSTMQSSTKCIDLEMCSLLLNSTKKFTHKGEKGHGLLIAGAAHMPGAALLAATTAMRGGLGKLTVHAPQSVLDKLAVVVPEAVHSIDKNAACYSQFESDIKNFDAIAIGSGLGKDQISASGTKHLLEMLTTHNPTIPLIIDADALNLLSENPDWFSILPASTIITPHIKEFERLAGPVNNDFERIDKVQEFAKKHNIIVILKGAHTVVSLPSGELFFNMSGNPGLATAGSGDLLTGLLLSFVAQQYAPHVAALLGVYLHGLAADLAIEEFHSEESLIASDVPYYIGKAFKKIK
jgi:ADP-dependent NAD(P)H-hydrate dehydratase / NAD(P)H-hydrate epimerase